MRGKEREREREKERERGGEYDFWRGETIKGNGHNTICNDRH